MEAEENTIKVIVTLYRKMALLKRLRAASPADRLEYIREVFEFNGLDPKMVLDADLRSRQNEIYLLEVDFDLTIQKNNKETDAEAFKRLIGDLRNSSDISVTPGAENLLDFSPDLRFGQSCNIRLQSLSFGTIIENTFIRYSQNISSVIDDPIVSFKLDAQRTMELYFLLGHQLHSMEFKYKRDIDTKIVVCSDNESTRIYFQLLLTPKIYLAHDGAFQYSVNQQVMSTDISPQKYLLDDDANIDVSWHRMRDFPGCSSLTFGYCTALELKVSDASCPKGRLMSFFKELMDRQYTITFGQFDTSPCDNYHRRWDDMFDFVSKQDSEFAFNVCWALKVLYSKGYIAINYVENHLLFWMTVKQYVLEDPEQLELALYKIAGILDDDRCIDLYYALRDSYADRTLKQEISEIENTKKIRACYVTPTGTMYFPPMDMLENRILLDYDPDYCLRVTYRDDDMTRINAKNSDFYDEIIRSNISNTIKVHDREFEFLACSNSQLRTHGVWFYARDPNGNTASIIRSKLGNFSGIDCIATFVARMGQCFSTSVRAIASIKQLGTEIRERDIETEDKKYNFSDGTGRISTNFARMLCENMHKMHKKVPPSLFQIRYGGCKGTVSVDNTMEGNIIVIRDSMAKFQCDKDDLEIVKIAGPFTIDSNIVTATDKFTYLGSIISSKSTCYDDINRRIAIATSTMSRLSAVWSSTRLSLATKLRLYNSLVLSIVTYSYASWTLTKAMQNRLNAFNTKALRRTLNVRWFDHITNDVILTRTNQPPLTTTIRKLRLGAFGHVCRLPHGTQAGDLLMSSPPTYWRRPVGRPPLRWADQITEDTNLPFADALAATTDRIGWRTLTRDATRSPTQAP